MESIYQNQFQIGTYKIHVYINDEPVCSNESTFIWGYMFSKSHDLLNDEWSADTLNDMSGYFWGLRVSDDKIEFVNDLLGGYRMYYRKWENEIWITDNYKYITDLLGKENVTLDNHQLMYWKKHRFTLDNNTLFKDINKFSPASIVTIYKNRIEYKTYFNDCKRKTNYRLLLETNFNVLREEIKTVRSENPDSKFVLFYSGGADSTLLLHICKELNINFICVLIEYVPKLDINYEDIERAAKYLDTFNLQYDIVKVDLTEAMENFGKIASNELLFDKHLAVHFYQTYNIVKEKYGNNIIIINGQSADNILSFGPSEYTVGNIVKRLILACSNNIFGLVSNILSKALPFVQFIFPYGATEATKAILDDSNYIYALDKKCSYREMLDNEITKIKYIGIKQYESMRMYAKIIAYLQGPDNQVVIRAARHSGINKVVMPYTSPDFIYNVVKYKSNFRDIFRPKYFVRDLLKDRYDYAPKTKYKIGKSNSVQINPEFKNFSKQSLNLYEQRIASLMKSGTSND